MSVPLSDRERFNKVGEVTIAGVKLYKYKYINYAGSSSRHTFTTKDFGSKTGSFGNKSKSDVFSGSGYAAASSSFKVDDALKSETIRDHVVENTNNPNLKNIYTQYRKNPSELTQAEKDQVVDWNENDQETFKLYLQFGVGVKENKLDEYLEGGAARFDALTEKTAEDFDNWAKNEDINNWIVEGTADEETGAQLKDESQILQGQEDPRFALVEQMYSDQQISDAERKALIGDEFTFDTSILGQIQEEERQARESFKEQQEESSDAIDDFRTRLEEGIQSRVADRDISLDQILDEYVQQREGTTQDLTSQIGDVSRQEDMRQAQTGLQRDRTTISELAESYMPVIESEIQDYRQETGKTSEEAMQDIRDYSSDTDINIQKELRDVTGSFEDLQESLGSYGVGSNVGQNILNELISGYRGGIFGNLSEIDDDTKAAWWESL